MSVQFTIDTHSVELTLERLDTALSPGGIAAFLKGAVEPYIKERAQSRFDSEGDDVSGKWQPLSPATQDIRSRGEWSVGAAHPINVRTTELERYITKSQGLVAPNALGATLTYPGSPPGTSGLTEKMRTAQQGRSNPRTPPRPVIGVNEQDLAVAVEMLVFHVNEAIAL